MMSLPSAGPKGTNRTGKNRKPSSTGKYGILMFLLLENCSEAQTGRRGAKTGDIPGVVSGEELTGVDF